MVDQPKTPMPVTFTCTGRATGKMRNELAIEMTEPMHETFTLATDEGKFHGGEASAPPPLAFFIGGLTGCIMTQIRAFAKRMDVEVRDLRVEATARWRWTPKGRIYETAPEGFDIDIYLDSPSPTEAQIALIEAAKKGCFIEQTLGRANSLTHRLEVDGEMVRIG